MDQIGPDPMFPLTPMQFRKPYGNTLRVIPQPRQAGRSENVPESVLKGCRRWKLDFFSCGMYKEYILFKLDHFWFEFAIYFLIL